MVSAFCGLHRFAYVTITFPVSKWLTILYDFFRSYDSINHHLFLYNIRQLPWESTQAPMLTIVNHTPDYLHNPTKLSTFATQKEKGLQDQSFRPYAKIAQLVEHNLAKVGVAGSSPVFRSKIPHVRVVKLVDTLLWGGSGRKAVRVRHSSRPPWKALQH